MMQYYADTKMMFQENEGKYSTHAIVKIAYKIMTRYQLYFPNMCVFMFACAQKKTRKIEDSNINSGYLWAVGLQESFLLCGFLVFSKLSKMYMCYFHYSKQIIFLKRKTKTQSTSSYFVAPFEKKTFHQIPQGLERKAIFVMPIVPTQNVTHRTCIQTQRKESLPILSGARSPGAAWSLYIFLFKGF